MTESNPVLSPESPETKRNRQIVLLLVLVTLLCYWPVGRCGYTNYDDTLYLTENGHVAKGITVESLKYAFTTVEGNCWQPLTWLSHMVGVELFGEKIDGRPLLAPLFHIEYSMPPGHHLINLLFHLANTVLLWHVLKRMTNLVWPSAWVAAMFAVHPMHVESVAWIAERKDVLSAFFFILTLLAYVRYLEVKTIGRYLLILLAYAAGLMSKPMIVTTPFVLLLLDIWPLRRLKTGLGGDVKMAILDKVPLLGLSAASCAITLFGTSSSDGFVHNRTLAYRLQLVVVSYARYLGKLVWPTNMSCIYPLPPGFSAGLVAASVLLLVVITVVVILLARRRQPVAMVGWFWFLGTLVPVCGLVLTGDAAIADRYTYIPYIGLFFAIAWLAYAMLNRWPQLLAALAIMTVLVSTGLTYRQVWVWESSSTLMRHALAVTSDNWVANLNYGCALSDSSREKEAEHYYREALRLNPNNFFCSLNVGRYLLDMKKTEEAIPYIVKAGRIRPDSAIYLLQVARIQDIHGQHLEAIKLLQYVLAEKPLSYDAYMAIASCYFALGQIDQAEPFLKRASEIESYQSRPFHRMGLIAAQRNDAQGAIDNFQKAIDREPDLGIAHLDYGISLAALHQFAASLAELTTASQTLQDNELQEKAKCEETIGRILEITRKPVDSAQHYLQAIAFAKQAVEATPNEPAPKVNLALMLKRLGHSEEATAAAKDALAAAATANNLYFIRELHAQFPTLPIPPTAATQPSTKPAVQLPVSSRTQNPK